MLAQAPIKIANKGTINIFIEVSSSIAGPEVGGAVSLTNSSLMLLALKIQGSGSIGAKDLAPLFICKAQWLDLADWFEIAHAHRVVCANNYTVCADNLDQVLQCRGRMDDGIEV